MKHFHPDDDATAVQERAVKAAFERRLSDIVRDAVQARAHLSDKDKAALGLRDCLIAQDDDTWADLPAVWRKYLTDEECARIMVCAFMSLPAKESSDVLSGLASGRCVPEFVTPELRKMEAKFWTETATPEDLRVFVYYAIKAMHPKDQSSLKEWLAK